MGRGNWSQKLNNTPKPYQAPKEAVESDSISSAELQTAILTQLTNGPMFKWTLRDVLRVNEARILKELLALRKLGKVHVIGRCLDKRQWTLTLKTAKVAPTATTQKKRLPRPLTERYADLLE